MDTYQMTDIHMHIIPGVDDGSFTMEMSETMLMMSWLQGGADGLCDAAQLGVPFGFGSGMGAIPVRLAFPMQS